VLLVLDFRSCPLHGPPPARTGWTPGHSGHTIESSCTLGRAAGGFGHTVCEFHRISQHVSRPSVQQGSPNGTSSALKHCFFFCLKVAFRCYAQSVLGSSGLTTAGYHTRIVAPDLKAHSLAAVGE